MNKSKLNELAAQLNGRLGLPERGKESYYLDHAACYGGYRLTRGDSVSFNNNGCDPRKSNKEMAAYLRGIHDTLDVLADLHA